MAPKTEVILTATIAVLGITDAILNFINDRRIKKRVNILETKTCLLDTEVEKLKKEKITNWMDSATEVLTAQQDQIDILEARVKEIREILEKTNQVKFND
jgi:hypothetical protein